MRQELAAFVEEQLVAIFFSFDFFQQFFFRLTLDAELRKRDSFQSPLTDFYATLRADTIGALGEPCQRFVDGLPASIAHFHQGNAQLAIEIHEGLIADVACRFKSPLFIFDEGLAQTPFNLFDNFLALPHQHLMEDLAPAFSVFAFFRCFFRFGSQGRDGHADRFFRDHNRSALWFARWFLELRPHLGLRCRFLLGGGFCCHGGSYS
jgi:hypothetical protein